MNILIIGGGNMGFTFAKAFINSRVVTADQLIILEKNPERMQFLKAEKVGTITDDTICVSKADLIVLAVKPQNAPLLFEEMNQHVEENQVFLSIMAGIKIKTIQKYLKAKKIIRAMPNLPSQIGMGMTAFTATEDVSRFELGAIQNLLATTGKTLHIGQENMIDAVTAISGSGPAYIFYYMDAMIQAAKSMGLSSSSSELLVLQTFKGTLALYQQNSLSCQEWIAKVSSKGGTTEAAIHQFKKHQVGQHIQNALNTAYNKAKELGNG